MENEDHHIRVIIVDDSIRYRIIIKKSLESRANISVVGEAVNGIEALELILKLKPDVILMDLEMPLMDGMTALQHLMIHIPTPTVMFSRLTREGTARCFDALKHGAVDFYCKDNLQLSAQDTPIMTEIVEKVLCASKVAVEAVEPISPQIPKSQTQKSFVKTLIFCEECGAKTELTVRENEDQGGAICGQCGEFISIQQRNQYRRANCISVIIAGAGSYNNLLQFIPALRQDMNGAVLVIADGNTEHINEFAEYLDSISTIKVVRVRDGVKLQGGNCYIGCEHEAIRLRPFSADYTITTNANEDGEDFVDNLIVSVAQVMKNRCFAVFLSGSQEHSSTGLMELLRSGGKAVVLEPERCMYKQMGLSLIKQFGSTTAADERELAVMINTMHQRYRDSIVTA